MAESPTSSHSSADRRSESFSPDPGPSLSSTTSQEDADRGLTQSRSCSPSRQMPRRSLSCDSISTSATSRPKRNRSPESHLTSADPVARPASPSTCSTRSTRSPTHDTRESLSYSTTPRPASRERPRYPEGVRNAQGQLVCDYVPCANGNPAFPRRCEWRKHMDKHTRPYLCTESSCALLKGFTYAGGLLRHEREVHSKHGGPRRGGADALRCPHPGCKRNEPGRGFTRNENLLEHLRRVHRSGGAHEVKVEDDVKALEPVVAKEDEATKCTTPSRKRKRVGDHHISPSQSSSSSSSPPTLRRSDEESFGLLLEDISSSASDAVDGNVKEAAVQMNMPLERQVKRLRRQNRAIILELRSLRAMIRGREGR